MSKLISVGQIIDYSWEEYRNHFFSFLNISGWLLVPTLIGMLALSIAPSVSVIDSGRDLFFFERAGALLLSVNNFLLAPIVGVWVFINLIRASFSLLEKKSFYFKKMAKESWNYFFPIIWFGIFVSLLVLIAMLFTVPGLVLNMLGMLFSLNILSFIGSMLIVVGVIAGIVFAIRWIVYYAFAQYILLIENLHGKKALTHSRQLVTGKFWPFFIRLIIPKIVFFLIAIVAESVILYFLDALIKLSVGLNAELEMRLVSLTSILILSIVTLLINPLIITADILLYRSLKENV